MTPLVNLNESYVNAIVAQLDANLSTVIDELNATAPDDTYTILHARQVLDYVPSPELLTAFPTIGVEDLPATFTDDLGSSMTTIPQQAVMVFIADPELAGLARKLRRYQQAILSTLLADRTLGDKVWGLEPVRVVPGPALGTEDKPQTYMSWSAVVLRANVEAL